MSAGLNNQIPGASAETIMPSDSLFPPVGKPTTHTPSFLQQFYQCLSVAALAMASYFVISHFVLQSVTVVGVSMVPTLQDSQRYLLNRWLYLIRAPQQNDIVVIRDPIDNGYSVKRIIGTAGDAIRLKDGHVYVNDRKLEEPYLAPGTPTYTYVKAKEQSIQCGKNQYFVLGDNRKNSTDSRTYGLVPRDRILGVIIR
jgi:signal peptidase I